MTRCIVHIADYWNPAPGSFIRAMCALAGRIRAEGDTFVYVTPRVPGMTWETMLVAAGAEIHYVDTPAEAARAAVACHPSVVHTHFSRFDIALSAALATCRIPLFWHVHTVRADHSRRARIKAYLRYRLFGRRVTAFIAVSDSIARELTRWYAPPRKIRIVPNAVDTEWFRPPTEAERGEARARYGFGMHERVALFFDRIPLKGGAFLLRALKQLPGISLLVVGGSDAVRAKFNDLPRVVSLEREHDTRWLYWAADLLVLPSVGEGMPFVLLEALSSGLPAVASPIAPVLEVRDAVEGVRVAEPQDAAAFARAIEDIPPARDERRNAAILTHFGVQRWSNAILSLYPEEQAGSRSLFRLKNPNS